MPISEGSPPNQHSDRATSKASPPSVEKPDNLSVREAYHDALALGFTAAILAFVGAIVVFSIPYVVLRAPLPASVNRLGMSVATTQGLLFGRPWYLLLPAMLIALWAGYRSYCWFHNATVTTSLPS